MLPNTRARTVFAEKHKYSFEDLDKGAGAAAQSVKRRVLGESAASSFAATASFGHSLLRSALAEVADETESEAEAEPTNPAACRQAGSSAAPPEGHLAGSLRSADLRKLLSSSRQSPCGPPAVSSTAGTVAAARPRPASLAEPAVHRVSPEVWAALAPGTPAGTPAHELRYCSTFVQQAAYAVMEKPG
ncbi:unnamed protein product [Polarella glacialis]|uniref:Uncharacterized protein n=1 Tax=Polarella glacialis TaxID=89957 RepID=A0A813GL35_POLGL|nr:unnamed protein product [Polarella glacialis]CAE8710404.1 unnamed protein product [Polarella glacialis]